MDIPTPPGILTDDEYDQIMGAGGPAAAPSEQRSFWLAQVNQYRAFRVSAPREKDMEARRQRLSRLDALALDPDGEAKRLQLDTILTAPPEQQAAAKDALLVDAMLAERKASAVNIAGSVWDVNRPPSVLAADRDAARDALAVEMFGETAPRGSDAAVAGKLREAATERRNLSWIIAGRDPAPSQQQVPTNVPASMHGPLMFPADTKQDAETKAINEASLARNAYRAGLAGLPVADAFAAWKEMAKKSPAWTPGADKQNFFEQFRAVYEDANKKASPMREKVRGVFEKLLAASRAEGAGAASLAGAVAGVGGGGVLSLADETAQLLEAMGPLEDVDTETLRGIVLPTIRALAETRKDDTGRDMWEKIVASFRRPMSRALGASWDTLGSLFATAPQMGTPTPETAEMMLEERQTTGRRNVARALLREATVSVIDPILTSAKSTAGKLAEQAVYDVAGSLGYMATTAIPYAGMAMTAAAFADQNLASLLNADPKLKVDDARVLAWAAAPIQAGLEKVQQMGLIGKLPGFNRAMNALAGPGGNPLARFAIYGAVATGAEYTIEKLQDATPLAAQDLLAAMKEDVPEADWTNFELFDLRTLLAVAPLALIGAGVNVARDSAATRELLSSTAAMKAVGMSDDAIAAVRNAPTVAAKLDAVAEGYAQRDPVAEPDIAWQETAAGAVADEEVNAAQQMAEQADAAGVRAVRRNSDGSFTVVANDGSAIEAASAQEAAAVIERISDDAQGWEDIAALAEISEALDMRPNAPTAASETTFAEAASVAQILEEQTTIANDPDATPAERMAAGRFVESLQQRVEIYEAANKGKRVDLTRLAVAGQSEMEVREGVATAVVRVGRGASPYVVLEERVEADVTAMLRSGEETADGFAEKIRDIERRTGGSYLFGYTGTDAAKDALAVKEALSLLTQIYVTGKARAGQAGTAAVPRITREWRKGTRAKLKTAEAEGAAPSVFAYLKSRIDWLKTVVKQAIRLNKAIRDAREKGEEFPLEAFLQRVTGVAPAVEAAKEVKEEAELVYNPPPEGDDLMAFNLTEQDARHADLERRAKAGDAAAEEEAQDMVDAAEKAAGYDLSHRRRDKKDPRKTGFIVLFAEDTKANDHYGPKNYLIRSSSLPEIPSWVYDWAENYTGETGDRLKITLNPLNIVLSAGFWDDPRFVGDFWNDNETQLLRDGIFGFRTNDGAVVFDPENANIKSADPFTYDDAGNLVPLSQRFDVTRPEISFSLQPEQMLDNVAASVQAKMGRSPQARVQMVAKARENLTALRDAFLRNQKGAGFVERRSVASLDSEQDVRQAIREEELLVAAGVTLASAQDIRRGRADAYRAELANQLDARGIEEKTTQQISREAGVRQTFRTQDLQRNVPLDDQTNEKDRAIMTAMAEQAAEEAQQWAEDYRENLAAARAEAEKAADAYVAEATGNNALAMEAAKQAAKDAKDWRKRMDQWQRADWDDRAVLTRAMRTLDAILAAFPAEVRGKVGGWLALARLGTQEAMAKEIERRLDILDKELERSLRADAIEEIRALVDRAKPTRKPGEKPTGKLGAEAHRYFDAVAEVLDMSADEVDARRIALEQQLADAATPEEQANVWEKQQILDTFGGLEAMRDRVPLHDAADLEAALAQAEQVYATGRNYWRTVEEARLADVAAKVAEASSAMPEAKTAAILAQGDAAKRISGMLKNGVLSLRSFRVILHLMLGKDNPLARQWADRAMLAMHQRTDEMREMNRRWFEVARKSTGKNRRKTEEELWTLVSERTVSATRRPGRPVSEPIPIESIPSLAGLGYTAQEIADAEAAFLALPADSRKEFVEIERWQADTEEAVDLTQAEGIYLTMLAAQDQYERPLAMAGWTAETLAEIEAGLSPLAKDMRTMMADEYRAGYYPLSSLFEGMFGVPLPQIENYAPGKWWSRGAEKAMDPSQAGLVEGGFRAGFLKNRKAHTAAPKIENAFEVFFGHANQTAHWKAIAPLARELRGVFADPALKQQIVATHGPEMLAVVNRWMESLEGNGLQIGYSRLYQIILDWQANVALSYKLGTLMKQSSAALGAAYKIPFRSYMRGMGRFIAGKLDVKDIWQSEMIQRRLEGGFSPEVRAAVSKTFLAAPTRRKVFLRSGMELIGYVDAAFTTISAAIAYDYHRTQALAAGMSEAAAKRQAMAETERIVTETAQPVEVTDRSLFEQTGWGKMMLMFGGDSRQKASMWVTALAAAIKGKATPDDVRVLAIAHLIAGPMIQIISSAWMDWRDDDDDEIFDEKNWEAWDFARSILLGPAAGLPLVREIVDDFSGDTGPLVGVGKAIGSAGSIIKGPEDNEPEKVEWYGKRITTILKGLSAFPAVVTGIGEQVFKVANNFIETDEEIRKKIEKLTNKLGREKDPEEQQALRERILGLQTQLR